MILIRKTICKEQREIFFQQVCLGLAYFFEGKKLTIHIEEGTPPSVVSQQLGVIIQTLDAGRYVTDDTAPDEEYEDGEGWKSG